MNLPFTAPPSLPLLPSVAPGKTGRLLPHPIWAWLLIMLPGAGFSAYMVAYLGTHLTALQELHPAGTWNVLALRFGLSQLLLLPLVAVLCRTIGRRFRFPLGLRETMALIAITPIPLWLSSFALLIPSLFYSELLVGFALLSSIQLCFSGVNRLCGEGDEVAKFLLAGLTCLGGTMAGTLALTLLLLA